MARKKTSKEKLNEFAEIDGKIASSNPTALEQIWGSDGMSKYKTLDVEDYIETLDDMLPVDLQNHARDIGLLPNVEPRVLRERLLAEFRKHVASYRNGSRVISNPSPKSVPKNITRILREGA